jgi:hypothetical protein
MAAHTTDAQLTPGIAATMLVIYLAVSLSAAAILLLKRDV